MMKGCVKWNPFTPEKISARAGLQPRTARSVGQRLTHLAIGLLSSSQVPCIWDALVCPNPAISCGLMHKHTCLPFPLNY